MDGIESNVEIIRKTKTGVSLAHANWLAEAKKRYGKNSSVWKFACPSCGHVQCLQDFLDAGVETDLAERVIGFSCIGRYLPKCKEAFTSSPGPCNYAGAGLFRIHPVQVEYEGVMRGVFDFADDPLVPDKAVKKEAS